VASDARIILIDPAEAGHSSLADRLRMQGYAVTEVTSVADGARAALGDPPAAVVADLWMPSVSGVQLCRLLKAEPATESVPVILRGPDGQRNRFWAERAGAAAYVTRGRMGDLVRALERAIAATPPTEAFFCDLNADDTDIRDRIAAHLDRALFESVLAAEVRALGTCGAFDRLFDLLSQFVSQVTSYRWLAVATTAPVRLGLHAHPAAQERAAMEARALLGLADDVPLVSVTDEDAFDDAAGPPAIVAPIVLGNVALGHIALAVRERCNAQDRDFVAVIARELAGPLRMASLVEESQRLATIDPLTTLMNRRAFLETMSLELARSERHGHPTSLVLLDVDHFKQINDRLGHATGDAVLAATGKLLRAFARKGDLVARWGGEEFLLLLYNSGPEGALIAAERLRKAIEGMAVFDAAAEPIAVTASLGVATYRRGDLPETVIDRADRAMYEAKSAGRNRVRGPSGTSPRTPAPEPSESAVEPSPESSPGSAPAPAVHASAAPQCQAAMPNPQFA
jgi:two-component system, cell cycle response regulator